MGVINNPAESDNVINNSKIKSLNALTLQELQKNLFSNGCIHVPCRYRVRMLSTTFNNFIAYRQMQERYKLEGHMLERNKLEWDISYRRKA